MVYNCIVPETAQTRLKVNLMPQDAFTLKYVIKELDEKLRGGKVSRINQPAKDELTLFIYTANGTVKLEICSHAQNCRINLAEGDKHSPKEAQAFCMLLRKHLQNAQILSVTQPRFERIAAIKFDCAGDFERAERVLYCEIMGKYSNVILVENGKILGAMKTATLESGAKRILFTGAAYELPAPQEKTDPTDTAALAAAMQGRRCDADFIANNVTGICYSTALDIEAAFGGDATAEDIARYVSGEFLSPCVTYKKGAPDDFKACCFYGEKKSYPTLLQAQTAYYAYVCAKKTFEDKKRRLEGALRTAEKKCEKRLGIILTRLEECKDMESVKLKGELITANIYAIERGASKFTAVNYYDENSPEITIQLDSRLTPAQNAQKYYKRYAKLKRTVAALSVQKKETEEEKAYLESIRCQLEAADDMRDFEEAETELTALGLIKAENAPKGKKRQTPAAPFRRYEYMGFTIIAGRNNMQNERLTKGLAPADMWLHTQKYHSSHVGILAEGRQVPEEVIKVAAEICAWYSQARDGAKVPVDYTLKKFVKKPSGAKTGFVVYTDYSTALATPDRHPELAISDGADL